MSTAGPSSEATSAGDAATRRFSDRDRVHHVATDLARGVVSSGELLHEVANLE